MQLDLNPLINPRLTLICARTAAADNDVASVDGNISHIFNTVAST